MLTVQQQAAIDCIRSGQHTVMPSTAGSGKTHTLRMAAQQLTGRVAYLTFSAHNAAEARTKMPAHVQALTFHALGDRLLRAHFRRHRVVFAHKEFKLSNIYGAPLQELSEEKAWAQGSARQIIRFLSGVHNMLVNTGQAPTPSSVVETMDRYGMTLDDVAATEYRKLKGLDLRDPALVARSVEWGQTVAAQQARRGIVDWTDRLTLPLEWDLIRPDFDTVMLDEAQDVNVPQREIALRLGQQLVIVGDPQQTIFLFTGARQDSLQTFGDHLQAEVRPLSVTFRCPVKHVALAQRFAPDMEAAPGALDGEVVHIEHEDLPDFVGPGDLVLSRLNGPLMSLAFRLARAGVPVTVRGRELVPRMIRELQVALSEPELPWKKEARFSRQQAEAAVKRTLEELRADEDPRKLIANDVRADALECALLAVKDTLPGQRFITLHDVQATAEALFADYPPSVAVVLSTVHRAKGLEARRVIIAKPHLMPQPHGNPDEEDNIIFVALTRSKHTLVFAHEMGTDTPVWTGG